MFVHHRITSSDFSMRPLVPSDQRQPWDLPVPVRSVSVRAQGLRPRRVRLCLAIAAQPIVPSVTSHDVGTLEFNRISRLNTRPARTPVNASAMPLLTVPHDSGPVWIATPSPYDSFIHDTSPVLTGAFGDIRKKVTNSPISAQGLSAVCWRACPPYVWQSFPLCFLSAIV